MNNWRDWIKQNKKIAMAGSIALGVVGLAVFNIVETAGSLLFLFGVIGVVVTIRVTGQPKEKQPKQQKTGSPQSATPMKSSPVLLKQGESVIISEYAVRYITQNRKVGQTAGFGGVSVPIGGGVRARVGGVKGQSVFADVTASHRGEFVLTNKRIVFVAAQKGFEFNLDKVSAITAGDGGTVILSTPQESVELHLLPPLKPKDGQKFMSGKLKKFSCITNAADVLTDRITKVRASG